MFRNRKKDEEINRLSSKIDKLEKNELENQKILLEIEKMIEHIENGFFMYEITLKSENAQIESVKNKINLLSKNLHLKISSVNNVLLDFGVSHLRVGLMKKLICQELLEV